MASTTKPAGRPAGASPTRTTVARQARGAALAAQEHQRKRRQFGLVLALTLLGALVATVALGSIFSGGSSTTTTAAAGAQVSAEPDAAAGEGATAPSAEVAPSAEAAAPSAEAAAPSADTAPSAEPAAGTPATPETPAAPPVAEGTASPPPAPPTPTAAAGATTAPQPSAGFVGLARGVGGADVATWQQRMQDRGWDITVDGVVGPETSRTIRAFQREKGLQVDGIVGPQTWDAAWTAPIT